MIIKCSLTLLMGCSPYRRPTPQGELDLQYPLLIIKGDKKVQRKGKALPWGTLERALRLAGWLTQQTNNRKLNLVAMSIFLKWRRLHSKVEHPNGTGLIPYQVHLLINDSGNFCFMDTSSEVAHNLFNSLCVTIGSHTKGYAELTVTS